MRYDLFPFIVLAAVIAGAVAWIATGSWNILIWVMIAAAMVFCIRSVLFDVYDGKRKTGVSESYDNFVSNPAEVILRCPKDTFGINPFYIYCGGRCVAKIHRGDELTIAVPKGTIDLGIIRTEGTVPKKYLHMSASDGTVVYVYPDENDNFLAYRLLVLKDDVFKGSVFSDYYRKQRSDSIRMSLGVTIMTILILSIVIIFVRPF